MNVLGSKRISLLSTLLTATAIASEPVFPGQDWKVATPESQGFNQQRLREAIDYLQSVAGDDGVGELAIVRNGHLVWAGPNVDRVHGIWSCTKSFTSTVLGLLIDNGACELDAPARRWLPDLSPAYDQVTLRHFATMTSGYRARGDEPRDGYRHGPSRTPFAVDARPLFSPPGSTYAYWDSAMNQLAHVLTRIAEEPIADVFRRQIADPIAMDAQQWRWGDFGERDGILLNGGAGNNGNHVHISARQFARLGHLFLSRGNWNGKQLLSEEWIAAATSPLVSADLVLHPDSGADGRGVYGLGWWSNGFRPDGKQKWPGVPPSAYAASGYNNNDMFIVPDWQLVVVRLGLDQSQKRITDEEYAEFLTRVGAAIE